MEPKRASKSASISLDREGGTAAPWTTHLCLDGSCKSVSLTSNDNCYWKLLPAKLQYSLCVCSFSWNISFFFYKSRNAKRWTHHSMHFIHLEHLLGWDECTLYAPFLVFGQNNDKKSLSLFALKGGWKQPNLGCFNCGVLSECFVGLIIKNLRHFLFICCFCFLFIMWQLFYYFF